MKRWVSEVGAFAGYVLFFLLAWSIASPILLILQRLRVDAEHSKAPLLISITLQGLCYTLMVATLMAATIAALIGVLNVAQIRAKRNEGTSVPHQPPS